LVIPRRYTATENVPETPPKVWLSASPEERARRRSCQTGEPFERALEGMRRRDRLDASRDAAPMARALDAVVVDTTGVAPEDVIKRIVDLARSRGASSLKNRV